MTDNHQTDGACANCFFNGDQARCRLSSLYKLSDEYKNYVRPLESNEADEDEEDD
jgi:hypothetical protein